MSRDGEASERSLRHERSLLLLMLPVPLNPSLLLGDHLVGPFHSGCASEIVAPGFRALYLSAKGRVVRTHDHPKRIREANKSLVLQLRQARRGQKLPNKRVRLA